MNTEPTLPLLYWWRMAVKHHWLVSTVIAASLAIGGTFSALMPKVYRAETTWRLARGKELFSARELIDIIGDTRKRERIATLLPKHAAFVHSVTLYELKGSTDKVRIAIESERPGEVDNALDELLSYLNRNPLLERSVVQARKVLQKQISELDGVIKQSVELQNVLYKLLRDGRLSPVGFNPLELSRRAADLQVERLSLQQALDNLSAVESAERTVVFKNPVQPKWPLNLAIAGVLGLVLGIALAIRRDPLTGAASTTKD